MKKYMCLWIENDGTQDAWFTDDFGKACEHQSTSEMCMGWRCEVYERTTDEDGIESYTLLLG